MKVQTDVKAGLLGCGGLLDIDIDIDIDIKLGGGCGRCGSKKTYHRC